MHKKRILVTGGAGFIGSHLVQHLLTQNWEVVVLDNCCVGNKLSRETLAKIEFIQADICNYEVVLAASKNCQAIVHFAALVGVDEVICQPIDTIEIEVVGTQNIGKAARVNNIQKIVYASSSAVYKNTLNEMSNETDQLHLVNDYAIAKRLNEVYLQSITTETGMPTNSLRFFNVYGMRQDSRMVIPRFFEQAFNDEPILVFGDGQQTRDFTHVNDVVSSISRLLIHQPVSGIFNIARGRETTVLELAETIKRVTQSNSKIQLLDFPEKRLDYKVNKRVGNPEKLFKSIGFRPSITLENGLTTYAQKLRLATGEMVKI